MKQNLKQTARKRLAAMALFLLICLPFSLAQAQTIKVNGRVTDDLNEPMIGVSIFEKGTTNGVITDMDGNYSLSVKKRSDDCLFLHRLPDTRKESSGRSNECDIERRH